MSTRPLLGLLLLVCTGACSYASNRARDFFEMFRAQGGIGRGLGVTVRAAGLLDVGLNTPGQFRHSSGAGLVYGDPYLFASGVHDIDFMRGLHDETLAVDADGRYFQSHKCWGFLPAVFSRVDTLSADAAYPASDDPEDWVEGPMLWSQEALDANPWAHVHAFDVEVGGYLLLLNAKVGFSPGEFADFLLGLFGVDIARDDR